MHTLAGLRGQGQRVIEEKHCRVSLAITNVNLLNPLMEDLMTQKVPSDKVKLVLDNETVEKDQPSRQSHYDHGISSLYGRVGDNITHHTRSPDYTRDLRAFPHAYVEYIKTVVRTIRVLIGI
ncbi:hypothetical protein [Fundidesulfovibrio agrisoli]|uniref:hypothetical protein n=1 Tax=Fundidesulfovibrio agrisoli TaxID=2922717 RepID=UPI001FACC8DD|nr:hypothetical protein [Fundidesulfovibrio agrisoli]